MRYIYILCLIVTVFILPAKGQDTHSYDSAAVSQDVVKKEDPSLPRTKNNMITVDPFLQLLRINFTYTRAIGDNWAIGGGVQTNTEDIMANIEGRYYLFGKALQGMYISPAIYIGNDFLVDALVGWQWFPEEYFTFGIAAGMEFGMSLDPILRGQIGFPW